MCSTSDAFPITKRQEENKKVQRFQNPEIKRGLRIISLDTHTKTFPTRKWRTHLFFTLTQTHEKIYKMTSYHVTNSRGVSGQPA